MSHVIGHCRQFFAHTLEGITDTDHWEPLADHLEHVGHRAGQFASGFNAADWGTLVGLWHDLGKYSHAFQDYLLKENGFEGHLEQYQGQVPHSTAGAQHAVRIFTELGQSEAGRILAYCIAGHHAGLADADTGRSGLNQRLKDNIPDWSAAPLEMLAATNLDPPSLTLSHGDIPRAAFQISLFCRMLFSCLVDADFLATEAFMSPDRSQARPQPPPPMEVLEKSLNVHLVALTANSGQNPVQKMRQEILAACRNAADRRPGLFSLTVPTGGGKTLSSLAFALKHAQQHRLERVIYAIPFTSIIEQTANVFRNVFDDLGEQIVLEHHSNLDPDENRESKTSRIAAENWDSPLVVTTNVQLFESLFASQTSRCRKLHRIARSVIILDEAQTLPVDLLKPCLAVLRELTTDYGCSIVLCTATQPALEKRPEFSIGLEDVREIISDPPSLYRRMKRVDVKCVGQWTNLELAERLAEHDRFLCIVNTRSHAAKIFDLLRQNSDGTADDSLYHLSTFMCGEHRWQIIQTIRDRLSAELPCRVVSTQLIEAGVDIDFPVVFRALSGIDSIAQAAGRCNREGKLDSADVFVFEPTDCRLRGYLKSVADSAKELLPDFDDLLDLHAVQRYFDIHYWKHNDRCDAKQVMECFQSPQHQVFQFRTAAQRFRMIEDNTQPVFVPYRKKGRKLIEELRNDATHANPGRLRDLLRRLQRYTVSLYENVYQEMLGSDIQLLHDQYPVLLNESLYDEHLGFRIDRRGFHEPESLIA